MTRARKRERERDRREGERGGMGNREEDRAEWVAAAAGAAANRCSRDAGMHTRPQLASQPTRQAAGCVLACPPLPSHRQT